MSQWGRFFLTHVRTLWEKMSQEEPSLLTHALLRGTPGTAFPTKHGVLTHSLPQRGRCRPQGRQERENVAGPRCGNDSERGEYANDFTVCWRSSSPSSVIRLAGDRRMPPSPAGGRKWRLRIRRTWRIVFGVAAGPSGTPAPTRAAAVSQWGRFFLTHAKTFSAKNESRRTVPF